MPNRSTRRSRAVRLTEEAVALLQQRLLGQWDEMGLEGRLTRSARAGLMDVSVGTAERILQRKGNDKAVLVQAFQSVGLAWSDDYFEPGISASTKDEGETAPELALESPFVSRSLRFRSRYAALLAVATIGAVVIGWSVVSAQGRQHGTHVKFLEAGRQAYHAGNFQEARQWLDKASAICRTNHEIYPMTEVMRMRGEILAAEGDLEGAVEQFRESLLIQRTFEQHWAFASLLETMADAERRLGRFEDAIGHLQESLAFFQRHPEDYRGAAAVARTLGKVYVDQDEPALAKQWFAVAHETMRKDPDPGMLLDMRAQTAILMHREGKSEATLELESCLKEWRNRNHKRWVAATLLQIAQVQKETGELGECRRRAAEAQRQFEEVGDRAGSIAARAVVEGLAAEVN